MVSLKELKKALLTSLWFVFLTFPILVIKVDAIERTVAWRWINSLYMATGVFTVYWLIRFYQQRKNRNQKTEVDIVPKANILHRMLQNPRQRFFFLGILGTLALIFPHFTSTYQVNVMTTALMYVMLGLGLNIVVGLAGLLDLGFVAFYAVGAYSYALLNLHFGLGFWAVLPIGGLLGALFGIILGFPVLRLRGDYLAIVTLGFGEIIRLVLENWGTFSKGPSGISNISRPGFFGMDLPLDQAIMYTYYIMVLFVIITIFVVNRLQDSRLGRAWLALREDEIACQA
ncbi:MAG: branched-chain amino acid ABC transporter permease, partial [Deltaproteobacteria bacterium]